MTVTLHLKPEIETGLQTQAQASGMNIEDYLSQLIEREFSAKAVNAEGSQESGMVWEDGLLVYRTGKPLPLPVIDDAIRLARDERFREVLG